MNHRFSAGQEVYYESTFGHDVARGVFKIVRPLPIERDDRVTYRIKSSAETFERTAEESELTRAV